MISDWLVGWYFNPMSTRAIGAIADLDLVKMIFVHGNGNKHEESPVGVICFIFLPIILKQISV